MNEIEDKIYKWEISPNPYDNDYDTFVTDDDYEARRTILDAAEMTLWDDHQGGTRTLTVELNKTN